MPPGVHTKDIIYISITMELCSWALVSSKYGYMSLVYESKLQCFISEKEVCSVKGGEYVYLGINFSFIYTV